MDDGITYEGSNEMDLKFSEYCGENVLVSEKKNKASWRHVYSGGIAFSALPFKDDIKMKLDLTRTGHAFIGVVTRDPETIQDMRDALLRDVIVAKEMKVHKRLAAINISAQNMDKKRTIIFDCAGETKTLDVTKYCQVWLFVYIKFGDLLALLHSDSSQHKFFHNVTGSNIRSFEHEKRSVKLHVENPAAICCLDRRLKPGQSVLIQTRVAAKNDHIPSRCHIKLGIVDLDAQELKARDPESFVIDSKAAMPTRWTIVHTLPKDNCEGELKLYLTNTGMLYYCHSTGVEGTYQCRLKDSDMGVSVILDLFRTEATIKDSHDDRTHECVDKNYDYVLPEGEIIESVKERLRLSDKRRLKEKNESDTCYLEMTHINPDSIRSDTEYKLNPRQSRCGVYRRKKSPVNMQMCT